MSRIMDIMDVDVEPLESQAYRRSKAAAQQQTSLPPIAPPSRTPSPHVEDYGDEGDDDNNGDDINNSNRKGKTPIRRRRSNRVSKPPSQSTVVRPSSARRRSSAVGEAMDSYALQAGASNQASTSGSPQRIFRGPEQLTDMPIKYTPVTGRISRARKGVPVHTCEICRPVKVFPPTHYTGYCSPRYRLLLEQNT